MQATIVAQGIDLMLYGMGTVFVFLTILVIATGLMSKLVARWFPEPEKQPAMAAPVAGDVDARTRAIIKAAIDQHRAR